MTYIIAVDDDPEVLDTLGRVLEREAFDVGLAKSGTEALMLLERRVPDALILDIIMPGMDGITLCRQVRRDPRFAALPVLFLTAKGSTDDIVDGLDAGADDYVVKPFELAELSALQLKRSGAEAGAVKHVERFCPELQFRLLAKGEALGERDILVEVRELAELRVVACLVAEVLRGGRELRAHLRREERRGLHEGIH